MRLNCNMYYKTNTENKFLEIPNTIQFSSTHIWFLLPVFELLHSND